MAVARREDHRLLTVGGTYIADLEIGGAAHVAFVRSSQAHAAIRNIHVDRATAIPGVIDIRTADDIDIAPLSPEPSMLNQQMPQPILARGVVRFVGEPLACVVADTAVNARRAAAAVRVDYDPLPFSLSAEEAQTDAVLLHPDAGTNIAFKLNFARPAGRADTFEGCDVVVRQVMRNQRLAPCPMEVRAGAAHWGSDGRLTYWGSSQGPHLWRRALAAGLQIPPERIRVITPDVGGAFGAKGLPYPEDFLLAWLADKLSRPLRYQETRTESMVGLGHGRAQHQLVELGGTRDGQLLAYRVTAVQDCGAYPRLGAFLPYATRTMLTGVYAIARAKFSCASVVTPTTPIVAYRGAGQPEATAAIERAVDIYALEIGMDAGELRRRNFVQPEQMPFSTLTRVTYDSGDYPAMLKTLLATAGYPALRAEQAERRSGSGARQLGIGLSTFVKITNAETRPESASIRIDATGRVIVECGTLTSGQGHESTYAHFAAHMLGISPDKIDVREGDSDALADGGGTGGSRSMQTGGVAISRAAQALLETALEIAAKVLDVSAAQFDSQTGLFHGVDGKVGLGAAQVGWGELAEAAGGELHAELTYHAAAATFPSGAYLAVVEVDTQTGQVWLRRMTTVDDAGCILNPQLATGQVHGGVAQGVAQALFEEMRYLDDGRPVTNTLADYLPIGAMEMPAIDSILVQGGTGINELGVKGIGESGTVGAPPAVMNAVIDAVAHLGVRHIDMPATPERVWQAIRAAEQIT